MSEIRDWHRPEHEFGKLLPVVVAPLLMIIPYFFRSMIEENPLPLIFVPVAVLIASMLVGRSFKKNKKVQFVCIILFATSSMFMMGVVMILQGGLAMVLSMIVIMFLLLTGIFLAVFLIERKVELIKITHDPPISPYLMGDLKRYIYWALKNNNLRINNYTNQMEAFYKGSMFKIIIKASTLNENENAEYSIVCRTKGKMDDPEFRTVKEIISEGLGELLSRRKIDQYPRPVKVVCRKGHTDVVLQPATGNYYCVKCRKVYSPKKVKVTWDPPLK